MRRTAPLNDVDRLGQTIADLQKQLAAVSRNSHVHTGGYTTAARPSASALGLGVQIYDKTLHIPLWSDGLVWRNASGTAV